jgi:hypothetical protein
MSFHFLKGPKKKHESMQNMHLLQHFDTCPMNSYPLRMQDRREIFLSNI